MKLKNLPESQLVTTLKSNRNKRVGFSNDNQENDDEFNRKQAKRNQPEMSTRAQTEVINRQRPLREDENDDLYRPQKEDRRKKGKARRDESADSQTVVERNTKLNAMVGRSPKPHIASDRSPRSHRLEDDDPDIISQPQRKQKKNPHYESVAERSPSSSPTREGNPPLRPTRGERAPTSPSWGRRSPSNSTRGANPPSNPARGTRQTRDGSLSADGRSTRAGRPTTNTIIESSAGFEPIVLGKGPMLQTRFDEIPAPQVIREVNENGKLVEMIPIEETVDDTNPNMKKVITRYKVVERDYSPEYDRNGNTVFKEPSFEFQRKGGQSQKDAAKRHNKELMNVMSAIDKQDNPNLSDSDDVDENSRVNNIMASREKKELQNDYVAKRDMDTFGVKFETNKMHNGVKGVAYTERNNYVMTDVKSGVSRARHEVGDVW